MSATDTFTLTPGRHTDPYRVGHDHDAGRNLARGHGEGGPASKRVIVGYGFWIFL